MPDDMQLSGAEPTFLVFTADETAIATAAAEFLEHLTPLERLHAKGSADLSDAARRQLGEMGWFGLAAPEAIGGSGLSAVEHALFFREVGRRCGPLDILSQVLAVLAAGDDSALRDSLIAGERGAALAVPEGAGLRIFGDPDSALAVSVDEGGAKLWDLAGLAREARPPLDEGTSMRVSAATPAKPVTETSGGEIWRLGQLGAAAMLVGVAEVALELIVEYAKVRETFGRKIGSYQAVRHPCADMAVRVEAARSQLWYAAAALKGGKGDASAHLDAAKHLANLAAVANSDANIQLHGGIGITDEHHSHLLLKRGLLLRRLFGARRGLLGRLLDSTLED